jgi:hypothetical protein
MNQQSSNNCSYCKIQGHRINNCIQKSQINEIDNRIKNTIIIGYCIFGKEARSIYTDRYLQNCKHTELHVLGYKYGIGHTINKLNMELYNKTLREKLDNNVMEYEYKFKQLFCEMDNTSILEFIFDMPKFLDVQCFIRIKQEIRFFRDFRKMKMQIKMEYTSFQDNIMDCPICMNENIYPINIINTNCNHRYCIDCIINLILVEREKQQNIIKCPLCRTIITKIISSNLRILHYCNNIEIQEHEIQEHEIQEHEIQEQLPKYEILKQICKILIKILLIIIVFLISLMICILNY